VPSLIIRSRAEADIDEALAWYHSRDPSLVRRFLDELDAVFNRIAQNPSQFPSVVDPIQRARFRRFPYAVFFIVVGDLAAVIAVLHHRRKPVDWAARQDEPV
jgi:toxin ParE1/3/4